MQKRTKILYLITQSELGGAQMYIRDLAKSFKDEFEVHVGFGEPGEKGELSIKLRKYAIKQHKIKYLRRAIHPFYDLIAFFNILKLIKDIKPDIIHLNSSKISILGSLIKIFNKKLKIVYTVHGWVFNEPMPKPLYYFYKYAEKFTAIFKDSLICVSEFDKQVGIKENLTVEDKLVTIHNGIKDINFYDKYAARKKIEEIYGKKIFTDKFSVGAVGGLYKTKGFEYLIDSVNIIVNTYRKDIKFYIIGEGKERKNLENLISIYNLKNHIFLLGRIKAPKYLKAFDMHILSSVKEGFPYIILEAMQASLPIVATNVGGVPEMIINNKTGLLVEPRNPKKIADKILEAYNNKSLQNALSNNAYHFAINEFQLKKMVKETKEVYLNLIK